MFLYEVKILKMNLKIRLYFIYVYIKVMKILIIICWDIFFYFFLKEGMYIFYFIF